MKGDPFDDLLGLGFGLGTASNALPTEVDNLTIEKLTKLMDDLKAANPRQYAELQLCAVLQKYPIETIEALTGMLQRGLFDFTKEEWFKDPRRKL